VIFYELALQLQQGGDEVALLGMLDTPVRGFWEYKPAFLGPIRQAKRQFLDFILRQRSDPNTPEFERFQHIWSMIWQAGQLSGADAGTSVSVTARLALVPSP
jgi:thioesterase domain-containing protein